MRHRVLAIIVTDEIAVDRDKHVRCTDIDTGIEKLKTETNYNFEALLQRTTEYKEEVLNVLFGAHEEFNLNEGWDYDSRVFT